MTDDNDDDENHWREEEKKSLKKIIKIQQLRKKNIPTSASFFADVSQILWIGGATKLHTHLTH